MNCTLDFFSPADGDEPMFIESGPGLVKAHLCYFMDANDIRGRAFARGVVHA